MPHYLEILGSCQLVIDAGGGFRLMFLVEW